MAGVQGNIRSFIAPVKGAGRTAPALLQDLTLYDPWRDPTPGPNLLADSPLKFIYSLHLGDLLPPEKCRHKFGLKPRQSHPPLVDERAGPQTIWTVAAICRLCRMHLHVKVDYSIRFEGAPCPTANHALHHLVRSEFQEPLERNAWKAQNPNSIDEVYTYKCSSHTCSATVTVRLSPPILRPSDVHTLVDPTLLFHRTEDAFRERDGNTEGMKHPLPVEVLTDLRAYVRNAWRAQEDAKYGSINLSNRRFIVRFGPEGKACQDVLERLGFQLVPNDCWRVPEPDRNDRQPFQSPINIWLDNAEHELVALILSRPKEEIQQVHDISPPVPAERELARALGCQDYDTHPGSRTDRHSPESRTAPYTALGCPMDLSDELVAKAYQWQVETDPHNAPTYLSNLRYIAGERQSEVLETEVVLETSRGRFDAETLNKAYKAFQLGGRESTATDDDILGSFEATLSDSASHEHELREYLRLIGVHRNSRRIIDTAQNVIDTYEQALAFLDADPTIEDEHIQALFAVKTSENKTLHDQAIRAVGIIAEHRKSRFLTNWIDSGFSNDTQMDAAEGYSALQIQNREVEDELILLQYNMAIEENPGSVEFYNKALAAIANGRNSTLLLDHLHSRAPQEPQGTLDEPVGLENIGNTCYLNSLLQFLFTVNDLRDVVLHFDQYKMELNETTMEHKRVGQRRVSSKEVQTAQQFVDSLASLFHGMIETPQSSIRPEQELARLTLETDSVKERMRRRSTLLSDGRPSISQLEKPLFTIAGPLASEAYENDVLLPNPILQSPVETSSALEVADPDSVAEHKDSQTATNASAITDDAVMNDNSSEATLVSKPDSDQDLLASTGVTEEDQRSILENKENLSPIKTGVSPVVSNHASAPLAPASPSKLNAQAGSLSLDPVPEENEKEVDPELRRYQPPPGKPPPVPPRKPIQNTTTTLEEYARQQDVTEVMNHCIHQFSCAMRPTGFDKSGEQRDEVHDLFFGQILVHPVPEKSAPTTVSQLNIITRVYHKPADVYAAIDSDYDLQETTNGQQAFTSIARLPPVLTVALDRVFWNSETKRQEKLNHHVEVLETIYMDRYLESATDSDLMQRRRQTWKIKKELASLSTRRSILEEKQGQSKDLPGLLEDAKIALEHLAETPEDSIYDLSVDPHTIAAVATLAENSRSELNEIRSRMEDLNQQVKEAFVDMRKDAYRLHAAFFHRGSAGGGHYWVYIYDHKKEVWRKYNDDRVTLIQNRNEIFGKPTEDNWGPPPNPYLLIYIRQDRLNEMVQTVKRDIVYPPPPTAPPPVPARTQLSAMPPSQNAEDLDLAMIDGGEQARTQTPDSNVYPYSLDMAPPQGQPKPIVPKEGDWDDAELMADRPIKW